MTSTDFDFQRYIQERTGASAATPAAGRHGVYAFSKDRRTQQRLERTRFLSHVLDMTTRLEQSWLQEDVLDKTERVPEDNPLDVLLQDACKRLTVAPPDLRLIDEIPGLAMAFELQGRVHLVVSRHVADDLDEAEQRFVVGTWLGHLANGHLPYLTTLLALRHRADAFYGVVVKPALAALTAWRRSAMITADRAGLLVCRDEGAARRALVRLAAAEVGVDDIDPAKWLADNADGEGQSRLHTADPTLTGRLRALEAFAGSRLYRDATGAGGGEPLSAVDTEVEGIVQAW